MSGRNCAECGQQILGPTSTLTEDGEPICMDCDPDVVTDSWPCHYCGEDFDTLTGRTMHTQRGKCPVVNRAEGVEEAEKEHGAGDLSRFVEGLSDD